MSVEIALKGVLTKFGIAYPKVHDVIPLIVKLFNEKNGKLPKEFVENENLIIDTFRELLKRRGPAGYTFNSNIKIADLKGDFNAYSSISFFIIHNIECSFISSYFYRSILKMKSYL